MYIEIRQEEKKDRILVNGLVRKAFATAEFSDQSEHLLVTRLRNSKAFIPSLSLIAEFEAKIVGHILLMQVHITGTISSNQVLALAPVSVLPEYQNKGIGSQLINHAHALANKLGFHIIVLIGHENYYPRFGYEPAHKYNINFPFNIPDKYCMVLFLKPEIALKIEGTVHYPKEFFQ